MAKDRYTEERDKQEAAKNAEIKELQEKAIKEALKMTEPPQLTEEDFKEIDEMRKKQKKVSAENYVKKTYSDYDQIPMRKKDDPTITDDSNDSVVSGGIRFDASGLSGSG